MALTAREWLLLPEDEQKLREKELSPEECFKLRMELSMIHFTEEEKRNMSEQDKYDFTHPKVFSSEEREKRSRDTFRFLQDNNILSKDAVWEEWEKKGRPLNM